MVLMMICLPGFLMGLRRPTIFPATMMTRMTWAMNLTMRMVPMSLMTRMTRVIVRPPPHVPAPRPVLRVRRGAVLTEAKLQTWSYLRR